MAGKLKLVRRPVTEAEYGFIEAYLSCGDVETACRAAGIPVSNGPALMAKPTIKLLLEAETGYRPAAEMDNTALMEEVLTAARDAARAGVHMAALKGYHLFHIIRCATPTIDVVETPEAERLELQRRAKAIS